MGKIDRFLTLTKLNRGYLRDGVAADTNVVTEQYGATITIIRNGTALSPQKVRIDVLTNTSLEGLSTDREVFTDRMRVIITGVVNHPSLPDTDIQRGDLFEYDNIVYEVIHIYPQTRGMKQAMAEVRS